MTKKEKKEKESLHNRIVEIFYDWSVLSQGANRPEDSYEYKEAQRMYRHFHKELKALQKLKWKMDQYDEFVYDNLVERKDEAIWWE